jgi:hypothetical protein
VSSPPVERESDWSIRNCSTLLRLLNSQAIAQFHDDTAAFGMTTDGCELLRIIRIFRAAFWLLRIIRIFRPGFWHLHEGAASTYFCQSCRACDTEKV